MTEPVRPRAVGLDHIALEVGDIAAISSISLCVWPTSRNTPPKLNPRLLLAMIYLQRLMKSAQKMGLRRWLRLETWFRQSCSLITGTWRKSPALILVPMSVYCNSAEIGSEANVTRSCPANETSGCEYPIKC